jgi:hypothetical protein
MLWIRAEEFEIPGTADGPIWSNPSAGAWIARED